MKLWTCLLVAMLAFSSVAEAKRLGGGGSFGRQSSNVTQRQGGQPPAQQTAPTNAQQQQAAAGAPAAAAAQRRPFGGMLGGLAAGLGLVWLAHALGFGEGFAQVLLLALLAVVVMAVIGAVMRSRRPAPAPRTGGYAWQAAGAGPDTVTPAPQYNPDKVGNDASARPWERSSMAFDAAKYSQDGQMGARIGSALSGPQSWGIPPGFDTEGFIAAAKRHFVTLQDAWDHADVATLRSMMTDDMLAEIQSQIAAREAESAGQPNRTEVVMLEARLLGIEDSGGDYLASVEFSGMMREDPSAGPSPFREVWNMTKPKNGAGGWLVAGVQALQ